MAIATIDREPPMVGASIIAGFKVLANYQNAVVLARSLNELAPEPFVVWHVADNGSTHSGSYFTSRQGAEAEFAARCFPWFTRPASLLTATGRNPEELIRFTQQYQSHRIGLYRGWMVVQPYDELDGDILCFMPSDEWEGGEFPDLDYLKDHYEAEWQAGSLQEAVDFIEGY